jgi:rhodanese-related sulfurtransferase
LDFTLVGSLITDRLTKQGSDLGDASKRIAQVALEAVEVVDGGFNGWLAGGGGNRSDVAVVSVD